jgi:hypothetical protein
LSIIPFVATRRLAMLSNSVDVVIFPPFAGNISLVGIQFKFYWGGKRSAI